MDFFNLVGSGSKSKQLSETVTLGDSSSSYGNRFTYDRQLPETTRTISGEGFEASDLTAWLTAMDTPNQTVAVTDHAGRVWTGVPTEVRWDDIEGTIYYSASVTLRNPVES